MKMSFRNRFLFFMGIVCLCTAAEYPQLRRRELQTRNNRSLHTMQSPLSEMMSQIHDRVSALATLDQAQRNKLDAIENKLLQLDSSTHARLESIRVQQQEASKQLENLEFGQRSVQSILGEIRNDLDVVRYSIEQKKELAPSHVHTRQVEAVDNDTESLTSKFDSLAIFLASTRASVSRIEKTLNDFGTTLSKLTQLSRGTHKRLSTLPSRQQFNSFASSQPQPQYPNVFNYAAPPPPPFASEPSSCAQGSLSETGILKIQLEPHTEPFYAFCESAEKGGWTVIQYRFDGSINFQRDWQEYKLGFGNLAGEFFIGLDKLYAMTATALHELMIVMVDFNNETRTANYGAFAIGGEKEFYALHILGEYSGTAGDSFSFQAGNKFSTFDNDNDGWVEGNCAQAHTGAWWHGACEMSNLNGQYLEGDVDASQQYQGMYWNEFHGPLYSLKSVEMKIRPIEPKDAL